MAKNIEIRNSTAEFLIFQIEGMKLSGVHRKLWRNYLTAPQIMSDFT